MRWSVAKSREPASHRPPATAIISATIQSRLVMSNRKHNATLWDKRPIGVPGLYGARPAVQSATAMAGPTTRQKALEVNLDHSQYGTFAEIGAGQEVARWFFRVGGASGTIAETVSAYDKQVSDARYGPCKRYVSRERLQAMLDFEYGRLRDKLSPRGDKTTFFVFADTVATAGHLRPG